MSPNSLYSPQIGHAPNPLTPPLLEGEDAFCVSGLGQQSLPVVVVSAHSGRFYPPSMVERSGLSQVQLAQAEDALVDKLIDPLDWQGAAVISANVARSYVDLNREPSEIEIELFETVGERTDTWRSPRVVAHLGVVPSVVTQTTPIYNCKLPSGEAERRLAQAYHPFHAALAELVEQTTRRFGGCLVVDCHSMPRVKSTLPEPLTTVPSTGALKPSGHLDVVIGDRFGNSVDHDIAQSFTSLFTSRGLVVERNRPFAGGTITQRYARRNDAYGNVQSIQIELARALYLMEDQNQETQREPNAQFYLISKLLCGAIVEAATKFADTLTPFDLAAE